MMKIIVTAHPNSKKPRVEKDLLGNIHIYVSEPPIEGKANKAITESLADYLNIKKGKLFLLSGHKLRIKVFEMI